MNKKLGKQVRELLLSEIDKVNNKEVGHLLSGGSGSTSVLFALLEADKVPHAYTFHMEGVESTDLIKARETCKRLDVRHTAIAIPNDIKTLQESCLYLINEVGCRLKTDIECSFPMQHTFPLVEESILFSALGDDNYFGLTKKAQMYYKSDLKLSQNYRQKVFDKYSVQFQFLTKMANKNDIQLLSPYQTKEMLQLFYPYTFQELNQPKIKQAILEAYPQNFSQMKTYHKNYQLGDSGIAEHFKQLVNSPWNLRNYKSPTGIYNSIARGEITELFTKEE